MANDGGLLTNWQDFLYELQGTMQRLFPSEFVFLAELSGAIIDRESGKVTYDSSQQRFTRAMDGNREVFHGSKVRFPLMLAGLQAGGNVAETGTWNVPIPLEIDAATVNLGRVLQPLAISLDLERDSRNGSTSAMSAVAAYTEEAFRAVARIENDELHGSTDAKLADASAANADADGLVMTMNAATNWDVLTPSRVVDVLTSSGTDPGQGLRRKIDSVDRSAATVTFSTTLQATGGGSGNITLSTNDLDIYIAGSYGNSLQGIGSALATTGTFEGIDKAAVSQWQGTDGRDGTTTTVALDDAIIDKGVYLARGKGVGFHDFGIAHPRVVDLYKQSKQSQVRYDPQEMTMRSGFSGIIYQGADRPYPIVKDLAAPRQKMRLVKKQTIQLYGDEQGPGFLDDDGSMWRFFSRKLLKEADLLDRVQVCFKDCAKLVQFANLDEAA